MAPLVVVPVAVSLALSGLVLAAAGISHRKPALFMAAALLVSTVAGFAFCTVALG